MGMEGLVGHARRSVRPSPIASWALLAALVTYAPSRALAQTTAADRALATELFQQGRALMGSKSYEEACPKLEESMRLDPGGGTLLNLAICHDELGKTATAFSEYAEAIAIAQRDGRPDREKLAQDRTKALEPRLMRVIIVVPEASEVEGLVVARNDAPVARVAWGVPMPLDPGTYTIRASAPSKVDWTSSVELREPGSRVVVTIPALEQMEEPSPPVVPLREPEPVAKKPVTPPPLARTEQADRSSGPLYMAAAVTGGVGAIGLVIGGALGGMAAGKKSDLDEVCDGDVEKLCPEGSNEQIDEMKTLAKGSTGSLVVGGIALGAATTLLTIGLVQDAHSPTTIAFGPGALTLRTRFH